MSEAIPLGVHHLILSYFIRISVFYPENFVEFLGWVVGDCLRFISLYIVIIIMFIEYLSYNGEFPRRESQIGSAANTLMVSNFNHPISLSI